MPKGKNMSLLYSEYRYSILSFLFGLISVLAFANSAPQVSCVIASQRGDDSKLVDIYYNLADTDGDVCSVWVVISDDGGTSWKVPAMTFTGSVGSSVTPGTNKHIIWDAGRDMPGKVATFKARVYADDGNGPSEMVLVPAGYFAFQGDYSMMVYVETFQIDKYEVTNQQYCEFLNKLGNDGYYYSKYINRTGSPGNYTYTVQSGKEQYPVMWVSYSGAEAFAAWKNATYGGVYRLPTRSEWQKAAGWDPVLHKLWQYGFQSNSIDSTWCNCDGAYGGPLPVGSFDGTGGKQLAKSYYGCFDMSGNVLEWISSNDGSYAGGAWLSFSCSITNFQSTGGGYYTDGYNGFRLVKVVN